MVRQFVLYEKYLCSKCQGSGVLHAGNTCWECDGKGYKLREVDFNEALQYALQSMSEEKQSGCTETA